MINEAMSYSCEKGRSSAYSEDMRWRMVWQKEALGKSLAKVSKNLGMDKSTISRTLSLFFASGSLKKKPCPKDKAFCKLTTPCQLLIMNLVIERPGIYLHELQDELRSTLEVEASLSAILQICTSKWTH